MIIRKFKKEDAKAVCVLVCKTFKEFVASVCTKKGAKEWLEEQTPEKQIERAKIRDIYVATINNKVVGMIEGKKNDRITRLFVDKKYHRKGIARNLTNKIEKLYRKKGSKKILTRSSLYAQKFYEKMGYKKIGRKIKRKGIVYQPMKKVLSRSKLRELIYGE